MARQNSTVTDKKQNTNGRQTYTGSMKTVGRGQSAVSGNPNYGSPKSLYNTSFNKVPATSSSKKKDEEEEKQKNKSNFVSSAQDKNKSPYSKAMYSSSWSSKPEEKKEYTLDNVFPSKAPEDRVNVGQLIYGLGEQAANEFVGNALSAADMLIGTPWQKVMDYTEEKLGLPDSGVNWLTAYNKHFQEDAAREAEYYAQNASKSKLASFINEYGPDVLSLIPEIALALATSGTSAVAGAGLKGLTTASKLSKADNAVDWLKLAGKWVNNDALKDAAVWIKNNPSAAMNFVQTNGAAREQALSEGATDEEAFSYALLNGGVDAMISKYGMGPTKRGLESLPENLRDVWKKVSQTVKSADAMAQEVAEGQMYGAMQRASRGIYDENAKLFSLQDENAVFNPKAMLESAALDAISPALMGEINASRTNGQYEPVRVEVDKGIGEKSSYKEGNKGKNGNNHNKENKNEKGEQEKHDESLQKLLSGNVLNSKEFKNLNTKDAKVLQLISEKSGIPISSSDIANPTVLRRKIQFAAMEIAKKNKK